jgi:hypothetical protein
VHICTQRLLTMGDESMGHTTEYVLRAHASLDQEYSSVQRQRPVSTFSSVSDRA